MREALSLESEVAPRASGEWEVRPVNSTARWPERLEHAATLLRAEGAAVVALRGGEFTTLFSYRIDPGVDWSALVGPERLHAAMAGETEWTKYYEANDDRPPRQMLLDVLDRFGEGGKDCHRCHGRSSLGR